MNRRHFLQSAGLVSLTPWVPGFVNSLSAATSAESDQKTLVVIELTGGNDGLNTVIPFQDPEYFKLRPKLALDPKKMYKINDLLAFHPSMQAAKELFDAGELAVVNGVGYPNPNRSHFASREIWHQGLRGSKRESGAGWLGRALDVSRGAKSTKMDGYFVGQGSVSSALVGRRAKVASLSRFQDLQLDRNLRDLPPENSTESSSDIRDFVHRQLATSYATAKKLQLTDMTAADGESYPQSRIGQQLRIVTQLMKTGSAARVYYTHHGGYDTHAGQAESHSGLLSRLTQSIKAFLGDLKKHKLDDRVLVLVFSEFGRRVAENSSFGTDHGTAGPVFLAGSPVKAGVHGEASKLNDLVNGDLKVQIDFRRIYSTLLDGWLGVPSEKVLTKKFKQMDLIND